MSYISHITCADFLPQELQNILRCLHSTPRSAVCVVADIVSGLPRVCQPAKGAAQASSSPGVLPKDHRPVQFGWFEGMHLKCSKWHFRACLDCCFLGLISVSLITSAARFTAFARASQAVWSTPYACQAMASNSNLVICLARHSMCTCQWHLAASMTWGFVPLFWGGRGGRQ